MIIKFQKCHFKKDPRPITRQRLSAAKSAINRQKEKYSLFAHEITETPEQRVEKQQKDTMRWKALMRKGWADDWRLARKVLRALDEEKRNEILTCWNNGLYPKSPEYLLDMLSRKAKEIYNQLRPRYSWEKEKVL